MLKARLCKSRELSLVNKLESFVSFQRDGKDRCTFKPDSRSELRVHSERG